MICPISMCRNNNDSDNIKYQKHHIYCFFEIFCICIERFYTFAKYYFTYVNSPKYDTRRIL